MKIINEKRVDLDEMACVCRKSDGFGIIVEVYSKDHGKLGSKSLPAHAHLFDTNRNALGEFELTFEAPMSISDIIWYRTPNPPEGYASKVLKWSRGFKFGVSNWFHALRVWEDFHSGQ